MITITGVLCLIFLLLLLLSLGWKRTLIDGRTYVLLYYFIVWGYVTKIEIRLIPDLLMALSFFIFYFTANVCSKAQHSYISNFYENISSNLENNMRPLSNRVQMLFVCIILCYCIFNLLINSYVYGSLTNALTRFYFRRPVNTPPSWNMLFSFMYLPCVFLLFVIRYSNSKYRQNRKWFYTGLIMLLFISFPGGTRGAVLKVFFIPFLADFILWIFREIRLTSLLNKGNLIICLFVAWLCLFLTSFRGNQYNSIDDILKEMTAFNIDESNAAFKGAQTDLMMRDYYRAYDDFGNKIDFLPWYYTAEVVGLNWIPRTIFPNKPIGVGRVLAFTRSGYYDFSFNDVEKFRASFAIGVHGEGWVNGGMVGLLLYSVLMGVYCGFCLSIYNYFLYRQTYISILIALLFFNCSTAFIRGDMISGISQGIYPLIITSFLLYLACKLKRITF